MPSQQMQMSPGPDAVQRKIVTFLPETTTDVVYNGYALCANSDYGTAATSENSRGMRAEKPSTGNLHNFLGVVDGAGVPDGFKYGDAVPVVAPEVNGVVCQGYTTEDCTLDSTILTVVAASYKLGGIGEGMIVGRAAQSVNRSSVNGPVLMRLMGVNRANLVSRMGTPAAATNVLSAAVWESCPWVEIGQDPGLGYRFFDDFDRPFIMADAVAQAGYCTKQDTGVTIQAGESVDELGGILEICNNDDDVDFGHLFLSDGVTMNNCVIAAATFKPFWFEARLKVVVLTTEIAIFIGLCEIGNVDDAGMVINTGEMKDENFIGFQTLCADTDALLPVFKADAQTKANGTSTAIVADTYFNVGLVGNGTTITGYINNVSKHAITAALIAGATFPSATALSLALMTQTGEASESAIQMDWWRFAQLR